MNVLPLFKSNFSIGKSILTLEGPSEEDKKSGEKKFDKYPEGPKSIFSILSEEDVSELVLLEDTFYSFYDAYKYCMDNKIKLVYGVNMYFSEDSSAENPSKCRISVFIKNKDGYADLIKLYAKFAQASFLTKDDLDNLLTKNLLLVIPFYDSFLHKNSLTFSAFSDYLLKFNPTFFIEDNNLPFDPIIKRAVTDIAGDKYKVVRSKTICYYSRKDIDAFLSYKCICNRSFKARSLSKPNFEHFSSDEFCWESYKEQAQNVL